jgi:hypothetical protein
VDYIGLFGGVLLIIGVTIVILSKKWKMFKFKPHKQCVHIFIYQSLSLNSFAWIIA